MSHASTRSGSCGERRIAEGRALPNALEAREATPTPTRTPLYLTPRHGSPTRVGKAGGNRGDKSATPKGRINRSLPHRSSIVMATPLHLR